MSAARTYSIPCKDEMCGIVFRNSFDSHSLQGELNDEFFAEGRRLERNLKISLVHNLAPIIRIIFKELLLMLSALREIAELRISKLWWISWVG